jgi:aspartate kinase
MPEFGIATKTDVAKLTLKSAPDRPGIGAQVFGSLWSYDINVELVSSAAGLEGGQDITLVVPQDHLNSAILKLKKIKEEIEAKDLLVDHNIAVVSVTYSALSKTPGVGAKVFSALSDAGINVEAVCSSTNAISCIIRAEDASKAEEALRKGLEE